MLVVPTGPGSFTGIRIGLATLKALAWSDKTPAVGVSSLDALAVGLGPSENCVASIIDARKGEVFVSVYGPSTDGKRSRLGEPFVSKPERALEEIDSRCGDQEVLFVGNGLAEYPTTFGERLCAAPMFNRVRAAALAHLGIRAYRQRGADSLPDIQPIYLRRSDAEIQVGAPTGRRETVVLQGK